MKRNFTRFIAIVILALTANIVMAQTYTFPVKGTQGFTMTQASRDGAHISYQLGQFSLSQIEYRGEEMSEISIKAISIPCDAGLPSLPADSRLIAIPQGAKATLHVVKAESQTFQNVNIAPALRVQLETEDPDMNYVKDMKVYGKNAFFPENPFVIGDSYIRGVDAVSLSITPFQYNPVTKELVVYTDIELAISYEGGNGHFGDDRLRSPYWDPILASELMNYDQLPVIDYNARMQEWIRNNRDGAEYIIVIPNNDGFMEPAQRLKEYRMKQGILTEVYRLDQIPATTTAQLKTWFHNAYNTWEIAPVAVMLFADHNTNMAQGIPAEEVYHSSSYGNCITDNQYADVTGDYLPEIVFSRLIAANPTEAAMMADKQIEYEFTNPNMDPNAYNVPITALGWQTERWFQLCSEVVGGYFRAHGKNPLRVNCIYSGTPGSQWSSGTNTNQVVSYFGPSGTNIIPQTPSELGGWTGGTPDQIVQAINQGTMLVQHRDHGLEEGWGEPAFRNTHVAQLTNVGKMPFVFSINCLTGQFDLSPGPCFAEAFMRHTYNGQNAGAVGMICPTDVSYSFCNDALVWGIYDQFEPDFMPTLPNNTNTTVYPSRGTWLPAFGLVAGKHFLNESGWPYNTDSKQITYQMFTSHCDAFLRLYTEVPQTMSVNHQNVQLAGLNTFQITAPEGTTIALTKGEGEDLEIVAVAAATGSVQNIEIPAQVPPTVLRLTVTGQNYLRYEANIEVIPAEGPYIIINEYALSNQATQLNFGENTGFDLVLKNVGSSQAPAGTATLTTESEYITITNGTIDFNAIASNSTTNLENAFTFTISDEVPNKTSIEFTVTITSGDDTYESHINMKAYAPVFEIGNVGIREINGNGNGRLDPGETVKLSFVVNNKGNADSHETNANLTINNVFMQLIGSANQTIDGIPANAGIDFEYQIYVGSAPSGFAAEYTLDVASGVYTDTKDFVSKIGLNVEDFESGSLDPSLWTNASSIPWTLNTEDPYEGNYCLKSGAIGNSAETLVSLDYDAAEADSIAFYYKVSSENGYDKLYFYIDNQERGNWSGNVSWTRGQYAITAGHHTFSWKYKKDSSVTGGSDCVWIDFVILPRDLSLAASAGLDVDACESEPAQILGYASNYETLTWTTAGDGTFDDATIANPMYTPGTQDIANGSVTLTITATKGTQTITDDMTVSFLKAVVLENALEPTVYCAIQEPQAIAVNVLEGDYTSFLWTTMGSGEFADPSALSTTYTLSAEDIEAGSVTLVATTESATCGPVSLEYPIEITPLPQIELTTEAIDICEGDNATMDFDMTGVDGTAVITINDTPYSINEGETSIDLGAVTETTVFNITEFATLCSTQYGDGELTFTVNVQPKVAVPEISGDTEIDVRLTPASTYTVTNDVMVEYAFEPSEAGNMEVANDGKTIEITWSETYKGQAVLTATPSDECNNGGSTLNITVKNSTSVNELEANTKLFPNPTTGKVNIECEGMIRISVYSAIGQMVYDEEVNADQFSIDLSQQPVGNYLVKIITEQSSVVKKLYVK